MYAGFQVIFSNYTTIADNVIEDVGHGIKSKGARFLKITGNEIINGKFSALWIYNFYERSHNVTITHNRLTGGDQVGLYTNGDNQTIIQNSISDTDGWGVFVPWADHVRIMTNTINNSTNSGLFAQYNNDITISWNNFIDNYEVKPIELLSSVNLEHNYYDFADLTDSDGDGYADTAQRIGDNTDDQPLAMQYELAPPADLKVVSQTDDQLMLSWSVASDNYGTEISRTIYMTTTPENPSSWTKVDTEITVDGDTANATLNLADIGDSTVSISIVSTAIDGRFILTSPVLSFTPDDTTDDEESSTTDDETTGDESTQQDSLPLLPGLILSLLALFIAVPILRKKSL